jgi:hypothetical protein
MRNIFRLPVDKAQFKKTIETGVSVSRISQFVSSEEKAIIKSISKKGLVNYWGSAPGESNTENFYKLKSGDEILCIRGGKYICLATVAFKLINKNLAGFTWGKKNTADTGELIYFFDEVELFEIDAAIIDAALGIKDNLVSGLSVVDDQSTQKFYDQYGNLKTFIKTAINRQQLRDILKLS